MSTFDHFIPKFKNFSKKKMLKFLFGFDVDNTDTYQTNVSLQIATKKKNYKQNVSMNEISLYLFIPSFHPSSSVPLWSPKSCDKVLDKRKKVIPSHSLTHPPLSLPVQYFNFYLISSCTCTTKQKSYYSIEYLQNQESQLYYYSIV